MCIFYFIYRSYWIFICFQISVKDTVFDVLVSFMDMADEDVRLKALTGLGKQYTLKYTYLWVIWYRNEHYSIYVSNKDWDQPSENVLQITPLGLEANIFKMCLFFP